MPLKNKVQCGDLNSITEERAEQKRNADRTPFDCWMVNWAVLSVGLLAAGDVCIQGDFSYLQQGEPRGFPLGK